MRQEGHPNCLGTFSLKSERFQLSRIGIYQSKENALEAIERVKLQPGFAEHPRLINPLEDDEEGFYIDGYKLNEDHWTEGYITV